MFQLIVLLSLLVAVVAPAQAEAPKKTDVQERIFNSFLRTAVEGDPNAQFVVGHRYEVGVGTAMDLDQAYYWYGRAAELGHPLAKMKMEERARTQNPAPAVASSPAAPTPKPAPKPVPKQPAPKPAKSASKPAPAAVEPPLPVTKEVKEPAPPQAPVVRSVDALAVVLDGQWLQGRGDAEYLPSAKASCLRASEAEIVCFSQELNRVVNNATFTYTVKASLSNFTKDGRFTLNYLYHVADIDENSGGPRGEQTAAKEFSAKLGWQEPGHRLECRALDENSVTCMKDKKQIHFTKK